MDGAEVEFTITRKARQHGKHGDTQRAILKNTLCSSPQRNGQECRSENRVREKEKGVTNDNIGPHKN